MPMTRPGTTRGTRPATTAAGACQLAGPATPTVTGPPSTGLPWTGLPWTGPPWTGPSLTVRSATASRPEPPAPAEPLIWIVPPFAPGRPAGSPPPGPGHGPY